MRQIVSTGPEETEKIASQWAQYLPSGTIVALFGDLGSGKTVIVRGIARGLGIWQPVRSPSFTLVHEYKTAAITLYHLDLYRLPDEQAVYAAGLEPYLFHPRAVTAIEWADRWLGPVSPTEVRFRADLPKPALYVWIETGQGTSRTILYEAVGIRALQ